MFGANLDRPLCLWPRSHEQAALVRTMDTYSTIVTASGRFLAGPLRPSGSNGFILPLHQLKGLESSVIRTS